MKSIANQPRGDTKDKTKALNKHKIQARQQNVKSEEKEMVEWEPFGNKR